GQAAADALRGHHRAVAGCNAGRSRLRADPGRGAGHPAAAGGQGDRLAGAGVCVRAAGDQADPRRRVANRPGNVVADRGRVHRQRRSHPPRAAAAVGRHQPAVGQLAGPHAAGRRRHDQRPCPGHPLQARRRRRCDRQRRQRCGRSLQGPAGHPQPLARVRPAGRLHHARPHRGPAARPGRACAGRHAAWQPDACRGRRTGPGDGHSACGGDRQPR
ncbi:hypothetical protein XPN_1080, partial [Xanthomonas arboricola pv. pruni MAFF 301427]